MLMYNALVCNRVFKSLATRSTLSAAKLVWMHVWTPSSQVGMGLNANWLDGVMVQCSVY